MHLGVSIMVNWGPSAIPGFDWLVSGSVSSPRPQLHREMAFTQHLSRFSRRNLIKLDRPLELYLSSRITPKCHLRTNSKHYCLPTAGKNFSSECKSQPERRNPNPQIPSFPHILTGKSPERLPTSRCTLSTTLKRRLLGSPLSPVRQWSQGPEKFCDMPKVSLRMRCWWRNWKQQHLN